MKMTRELQTDLQVVDNILQTGISNNTIHYYRMFNEIPNIHTYTNINCNVLQTLYDNGYEIGWLYNKSLDITFDEFEISKKIFLFNKNINTGCMILSDFNHSQCIIEFYYNKNIDNTNFQNIIKDFPYIRPINNDPKIYLLKNTNDGLKKVKLSLPIQKIDIKNYYNDDFQPIFEKIVRKLSEENSKGLVLLHGIMGSGKSNLIKYLTTVVNTKDFIFIPSYMSNVIINPDFIDFILTQRNTILVLEDAETILMKRDSSNGSSQAVSNILNLTDGILADGLNIQIIATFNTDLKNLDEALLRKGRLIAKYEFKELENDKCNKIFENNSVDYRTNVPMTLAEIFNVDDKIGMVEKVVKTKIGF